MTVYFSGFTFLSREITMLSVMSVAGMLASAAVGRSLVKKHNLVMQDAFYMLLFILIGLFTGAKLFYFIFSVDSVWLPELVFFRILCGS